MAISRTQKIALIHIIFWLIYMIRSRLFWHENFPTLDVVVVNTFFLAMPTYVNYFILAPRLLLPAAPLPNKIAKAALWLGAYFSLHMTSLHGGLQGYFQQGTTFWNPMKLEWSMIMFVYMGTFSTGSRWLLDWYKNRIFNANLETKMNTAALQNFKTSLNPSFVLETLTNLISQSRQSPSSVQVPLLHVADVLRHTIYAAPYEHIPVSEELQVLEEYVALQNRYHHQFQLRLQQSGAPELSIPPNLFLRLIQEWVALSRESLEGFVNIPLRLSKEKMQVSLELGNWTQPQKDRFLVYVKEIQELVKGFSYKLLGKELHVSYKA